VHQSVEVGTTAWVDQAQLTIEDCHLCWQLGEGFHHAWQTVAVFGSAFRIEANAAAVFDDLKSEPIPFRFVQPIIALGRANGRGRAKGTDGRERGHGLYFLLNPQSLPVFSCCVCRGSRGGALCTAVRNVSLLRAV
jgi:hypothetical protein